MLYVLALIALLGALVLGTVNLMGATPGAAGAVSLGLVLAVVLLCAQAVLNYTHHHHRRHSHL